MTISKRQAGTTLQYVAADLGLDVQRRLFNPPRAEGRHTGVHITVELTQDAGWMTPEPEIAPDDEDVDVELAPLAPGSWRVAASSHHADLGCGFKMVRQIDGSDAVGVQMRLETGDDVFDAVVHVVAVAPERARVLLDEPTRKLILAFFESGVEACITDTEIVIMPQVTARALSSRLRNAARMSRLLDQRLAQIAAVDDSALDDASAGSDAPTSAAVDGVGDAEVGGVGDAEVDGVGDTEVDGVGDAEVDGVGGAEVAKADKAAETDDT